MQGPQTQKVERPIHTPPLPSLRMDYKKVSGKRLRDAREAKKLTLDQLSVEIRGILSPSRLSNYEQGIRAMGPAEALAVARKLGVEPSFLLCVEPEQKPEEGDMTPQETELLRNFRALPENQRGDFFRSLEIMALVHRTPVPDSKLPVEVRKGTRHKRKSPAK